MNDKAAVLTLPMISTKSMRLTDSKDSMELMYMEHLCLDEISQSAPIKRYAFWFHGFFQTSTRLEKG